MGKPRPTPPPSEIVKVLETMRGHDTGPLHWDNAREVIRRSLRTVRGRADEWLRSVVLADKPEAYWMQVSHRGMLHGIVRDTGPSLTIRSMDQVGFAVDSIQLDSDGGVWEGSAHAHPPERGWSADHGSNGTYVVILKSTLDSLVARQVEVNNARSVQFAAEKTVKAAALELEHGEAVRYIRGLLDAAGIDVTGLRGSRMETSPSQTIGSRRRAARVEVTLYGEHIDVLGAALKSLGVQPKERDE
jgi:hypothetical protein